MNYDFTKDYGKLVRVMAAEFNKGRDIYEAASVLPKYSDYHFVFSRLAYKELYEKFYPDNQDEVTFVIDNYVMSNSVATAFLEHLHADSGVAIEFIKREIGDAYSMLRQIQQLLQGMAITSHPEDGTHELYEFTINNIIKPVVEEANANEEYIKAALASYIAQGSKRINVIKDDFTEQEKSQETKVTTDHIKKDIDSILYQIKDYKQCVRLYEYLQETKVLDDRTSLQVFLDAIVHADMSMITPIHITRFRCAVQRTKWTVSGDVDLWARLACGSIGKTPSQALSGASNNAAWFEDLCEILPEYPIKK